MPTLSAKRVDRKRSILEAARALFAHFGPRKVTMEDIARKANLAKATLYYYFKSREDILREIIRNEGAELWQRVNEAVARERDPVAKLKAYVHTRFRAIEELTVYYSSLTEEYLRNYEFIETERRVYTELELKTIEGILQEGVRQGVFEVANPRLAAFAITMAMKGLEYPLIVDKGVEVDGRHLGMDEALDMMLDLLLHGILKTEGATDKS